MTQENSSPKKDFYAFYQQATVGPCPVSAPPVGLSKTETSKWFVDRILHRKRSFAKLTGHFLPLIREKWRNLGQMTRHEAMKRYTTALDNLVDDWRRSANVRSPALYRSTSGTSSAGDVGVGTTLAAAAVGGAVSSQLWMMNAHIFVQWKANN